MLIRRMNENIWREQSRHGVGSACGSVPKHRGRSIGKGRRSGQVGRS